MLCLLQWTIYTIEGYAQYATKLTKPIVYMYVKCYEWNGITLVSADVVELISYLVQTLRDD